MARPIRIAPSILSADFGRLPEEVRAISTADYVHVDVMDGHFVPNLTIGPVVVEAVRRATRLPLDVHLMMNDAERWAAAYAHAGADLIRLRPRPGPPVRLTPPGLSAPAPHAPPDPRSRQAGVRRANPAHAARDALV